MGWVGPAVAIAGTAITAYSQVRGGYAASQAAQYNEQMARYEAEFQEEKAKREEEEHREEVRRKIGEQTVAGAAAGAVGAGSDLSPLRETLTQGEIDAALIRYGGAVESWRGKSAARLYGQEAKEYTTAGWLGAGGTILGAATYYDWSKFKAPTGTGIPKGRWSPRTRPGWPTIR